MFQLQKNAIIIIVRCNYKSPELSIKKSPIMNNYELSLKNIIMMKSLDNVSRF